MKLRILLDFTHENPETSRWKQLMVDIVDDFVALLKMPHERCAVSAVCHAHAAPQAAHV